ncbi:hypothetical protein N7474_005729 [Penicillium riverlandense]|uniref:uncharacterized protein n=1 Tax=Penicillium riverlandense TaxID=1903569 RepID=UPI0025495A27|nr:uncharacterized protein N7474_005729 [Penicillium riverlandense]KAJ5820138.1 hypothetical protein N7474_005729 [Penicillium riverlandense]
MTPPVSNLRPIARFPITQTLYDHVWSKKGRIVPRAQLVSDGLCDDILHRLSPFLRRDAPLDILDLWPGCGLWSSKVNDLLRPRRHVLIEPTLQYFGPMLRPLANSKPCYELLSMNIYKQNNWDDIMTKYLPEQGPPSRNNTDSLPKNDALLVLASPTLPVSKRDHYTPSRWWSHLMESCMQQTGLHRYGSVRVLASLPVSEMQAVLPRAVHHRKRASILTDTVALHTFEVASPYDSDTELLCNIKGWDVLTRGAKRVAERTAAQGITTPAGREPVAIPMAPESPEAGKNPLPHIPRLFVDSHKQIMKDIARGRQAEKKDTPDKQKHKRIASTAISRLKHENSQAHAREVIAKMALELDELSRTLSRAAANPNQSQEQLKVLDDQIATLQSALSEKTDRALVKFRNPALQRIDDDRAAEQSNNFDDSILLWDRRPFEPLRIDPEEEYPREKSRCLVYFEADPNPPIIQHLHSFPPEEQHDLLRIYESFTLAANNRGAMPLSDFLPLIFINRPVNDIVKAIPSLAEYATKRLKPGAGPIALEDPNSADPNTLYQENLDYDLSTCRLRSLPVRVLWDIIVEYKRTATNVSTVQLSRMLGGTLTAFRAGGDFVPAHKLH